MKLKKKYLLIIIIAVIILLGLVFVSFKMHKTNDDKVKDDVTTPKEVTIIDEKSKSRPIAFTIDNSDEARELHSGIQNAYLVYEMINYADGRTRFLALYKDSDTSKVGPIRSVRHYHLDYVLENDAILAHWGQSSIAKENLAKLKINDVNGITYGSDNVQDKIGNSKYFWTDSNSKYSISHRRFTSIELINKAITKLKNEKETEQSNLFKYSASLIDMKDKEVSNASKVDIYFSKTNYVTYEYDKDSDSYLRSVKGKKHIDNLTNEQIKVKNIIVYKVRNYTIEGNVDILQELENVGKGEGYYITNGKSIKINWEKECHSCQTKYTYDDGSEVILNDGNTFIEIMPTNRELNIS